MYAARELVSQEISYMQNTEAIAGKLRNEELRRYSINRITNDWDSCQ